MRARIDKVVTQGDATTLIVAVDPEGERVRDPAAGGMPVVAPAVLLRGYVEGVAVDFLLTPHEAITIGSGMCVAAGGLIERPPMVASIARPDDGLGTRGPSRLIIPGGRH